MKRLLVAGVIAVLLSGALFQKGISFEGKGDPAASLLSFGELPDGDTLVVIYKIWGCHHRHEIMFRFQAGFSPAVTAMDIGTRFVESDEHPGKMVEKEPVLLGPITLTDDDIEQLDNLLELYRLPPDADCKQRYPDYDQYSVHISRMSNGQSLAEQEFSDAPCKLDPDEKEQILTFWKLWERFEKAKAQIQSEKKEAITLPSIE